MKKTTPKIVLSVVSMTAAVVGSMAVVTGALTASGALLYLAAGAGAISIVMNLVTLALPDRRPNTPETSGGRSGRRKPLPSDSSTNLIKRAAA